MYVEQFEQPLISFHCYVHETSVNIQDVQQWGRTLYENVSLDNDQLNVEEISAVSHRECNPKSERTNDYFSHEDGNTNLK